MRRHPPLWVYFFGLFAVAVAQRALFPPADHSVAVNVIVFAVLATAVVVGLTLLERGRHRQRPR